jgi:hypothetical protein
MQSSENQPKQGGLVCCGMSSSPTLYQVIDSNTIADPLPDSNINRKASFGENRFLRRFFHFSTEA